MQGTAAAAAAGHSYEQKRQPIETIAPLGTGRCTTTCTKDFEQDAQMQLRSREAGV